MSLVKFKTGSRAQLDTTAIENGNVYFIPDANDGLGDIAYDLDNCRSWVTSSKIIAAIDLDNSIPKVGELIVVTDAFSTIDEETQIITSYPGLKIGNGTTSVSNLPYIDNDSRVRASILEEQYEDLRKGLDEHIEDTNIHHTENARVVQSGDQFVLQILNY